MSKNPVIDLVKEISGQANTLTIPRVLISLTGDIISALVLSQIIYWSTRTDDEGGWFYKSDAEFSDELGVSPKQLRRVRETLSDFGVESERRGMPARMHYRIDIEELTKKLVMTFGNNRAETEAQSGQKVNTSCDKRAEHVSDKRSQLHNKETEITSEITTETTSPPIPQQQTSNHAKTRGGKREEGKNPRATGTNPRAAGTNSRATGTNPRALGENPRAQPEPVHTLSQAGEEEKSSNPENQNPKPSREIKTDPYRIAQQLKGEARRSFNLAKAAPQAEMLACWLIEQDKSAWESLAALRNTARPKQQQFLLWLVELDQHLTRFGLPAVSRALRGAALETNGSNPWAYYTRLLTSQHKLEREKSEHAEVFRNPAEDYLRVEASRQGISYEQLQSELRGYA